MKYITPFALCSLCEGRGVAKPVCVDLFDHSDFGRATVGIARSL